MLPGRIWHASPKDVVVGYVVELDKNDTTPYDVAVSAPFTSH